ncbi:MAG: SH3 domain-containing protein [Thermodesulfobacteriota bacterium]
MTSFNDRSVRKSCVLVAGLLLLMLCFPDFSRAERLAVGVQKANVRSGPGSQFDVIWEVEQYHPFEVITKKGEWIRIRDFEKDEAWIHQSLLQKIDTVITSKDQCNVRSGPGSNFDIIFTTEKGIPFKVISRQDQWLQIEHADKDRGWIHQSLVW